MLVLTRRPNQDILFPNLGVRLRILSAKGNNVRIGVEAPPDIKVLRWEVASPEEIAAATTPPAQSPSHALRNRLNKFTLGLYRLQQLWGAGKEEEAKAILQSTLDALEALNRDCTPSNARPAENKPQPRKRCRTLLVEDDANERELLAGFLSMSGVDCETAADGQDALDYLCSHELPDCVLLDMGLPRLSGPQTLDRIRREPRCRGLKVFAVSGSQPADLGIPSGPAGVDAWFTKPINPRGLWEALQQRLGAASQAN
jgi:carbon storage regulator CsrA